MIGLIPELVYNDNFEVKDFTLKFEIDKEFLDYVLAISPATSTNWAGIKRINIFKYFEDMNMLLPIETKYDVANNIVYTTINEFESYSNLTY